jgi:ArsR family metal-binding transcriptional regulator
MEQNTADAQASGKIDSIQAMRGIAAAVVLLLHGTYGLLPDKNCKKLHNSNCFYFADKRVCNLISMNQDIKNPQALAWGLSILQSF